MSRLMTMPRDHLGRTLTKLRINALVTSLNELTKLLRDLLDAASELVRLRLHWSNQPDRSVSPEAENDCSKKQLVRHGYSPLMGTPASDPRVYLNFIPLFAN
jgi:hypothetical protein